MPWLREAGTQSNLCRVGFASPLNRSPRSILMARQRLGHKKVAKLKQQTGLPVIAVLVRGGTGHRRDLCLEDGTVVHLYADGSMEKSAFGHAIKPAAT